MIKKIIVELADIEQTFEEFATVEDFMASPLFKTEMSSPEPVAPDVVASTETVSTDDAPAVPKTPVNPAE